MYREGLGLQDIQAALNHQSMEASLEQVLEFQGQPQIQLSVFSPMVLQYQQRMSVLVQLLDQALLVELFSQVLAQVLVELVLQYPLVLVQQAKANLLELESNSLEVLVSAQVANRPNHMYQVLELVLFQAEVVIPMVERMEFLLVQVLALELELELERCLERNL